MRGLPLILGLSLAALAAAREFIGKPYLGVFFWLGSLAALVRAFPPDPPSTAAGSQRSARRTLALAALIVLPALVRWASIRPDRIHGDEILTATFSAAYDLRRTDFFAPVPRDPAEWVSQFPAPFFVLQKLFFTLCGTSLATMKLSVLPYVVMATAFLFLVARELAGERVALLAVAVHAMFGPSLYLETLGVHFVSSTAVFLAFFYYVLRERRGGAARNALLAGLLAGTCYLFYLSSFLALPLAMLAFLLRGSPPRERHVMRNACLFVLGFAAVLAPFAAHAARVPSDYFHRFGQVALLGGEWSMYRPGGGGAAVPPLRAASQNLRLSLRSLYAAGIGGHGGYDFGRQALLEPLALVLAVGGALRAACLGRSRSEWALVFATIVVSFAAGMALTIPPPAFHRFSIAFPFLALLIALPLDALAASSIGGREARWVALALVAGALLITQRAYFLRAVLPEIDSEPLRLARFLDARFPDRPIYVAAYPSFAFEKIYRFAATRPRPVMSAYHSALLATLNPARRYVYVLTLPDSFAAAFAARDPQGRLLRFSPEYAVFAN